MRDVTKLFERIREWRHDPTRAATIDTAKASPPPSPLAPVDLTDHAQVAGVMDIAARIGDILLSSGTSNSDTKAQIHAVTSAYGLVWCHVDITLNTITVFAQIGTVRKTPVTVFRVVRNLGQDFSKLAEVDRLIRSIQAGATPPEVAEQSLNEIEARPAAFGPRFALMGWGLMGAGVAVLLGGGALVTLITLVMSVIIMGVGAWLGKKRLPYFFQNVVGGFLATLPAALAFATASAFGVELRPSQIIASCIIVMLAGLTLVQSLQDGITGAPVTASAHFFETMLFTGAVIAGVGIGLQAVAAGGIFLPPIESVAPANFASAWARCVGGGLASAGFAWACYAEWGAIGLAGITGTCAQVFYYYFFIPIGVSPILSSTAAAVIVGLAGGLLARRFMVPPLITAISGVTPFLPGLSVYRGMYAMLNEQALVGFTNVATALAIACGLAAGVVFGEWVARRIRRPRRFNPYRAFRGAARHTYLHAKTLAAHRPRRQEPGARKRLRGHGVQ